LSDCTTDSNTSHPLRKICDWKFKQGVAWDWNTDRNSDEGTDHDDDRCDLEGKPQSSRPWSFIDGAFIYSVYKKAHSTHYRQIEDGVMG
jgi:hypothetical protein